MPNCPECANREIQKKRKQLEEESEAAYEEGKDIRLPTYREMEEEIDFPMKLDPSTNISSVNGVVSTQLENKLAI